MSRVRGLLTEPGGWLCDCTPRFPAVYLEVKKENHNKGRHFYTCQKPQDERCGFFLWDTEAEKREIVQFGDTLANKKNGGEKAAPIREVEPIAAVAPKEVVPPSKQTPVQKLYPALPPTDDDGFEYFDTPTRPRHQTGVKSVIEEENYDWEDSDEDIVYKKNFLNIINLPQKRQRFEVDYYSMEDIEFSPPQSPPAFKKPTLADPFTTPPKQVTSTPHTPPETRLVKQSPATNLLPLSYSLLHQLRGHAKAMGAPLWQALREHLLRCGRVAEGAVKGRESARAVNKKMEIRIAELETRVKILEAEREVDKAIIGAMQRNVDVLTGKVQRPD